MHAGIVITWHNVLLVAALVCSILATMKIAEPTWFAWIGGTLMFLILALIFVA